MQKKIFRVAVALAGMLSLFAMSAAPALAVTTSADYTNNSAASAQFGRSAADRVVFDITVENDMLVHNGAQASAANGALVAFPAATTFYDDNAANDGVYTDGEAVVNDVDTDLRPSGGDAVLTAGTAKVRELVAADNVQFDGTSGDDAEYTTGDVIWFDANSNDAFNTGVDVILVVNTAPNATVNAFDPAGEQEIAYLDENNDGLYTCARAATCEPIVYSGANATNITADGQNLPIGAAFFDSSTEATDGNGTYIGWDEATGAEDLNAFPSTDRFRDNNAGATYTDGEDIYREVDSGSAPVDNVIDRLQLNALTVQNAGTALFNDISEVRLWLDAGAAGFQGAGIDTDLGAFTADANGWFISGLTTDLSAANNQRLFVSVDIFAGADHGRTIQLRIPMLSDVNTNGAFDAGDEGAFFDGAETIGDGPSDALILNASQQTIIVLSAGATVADTTAPAAVGNLKVEAAGSGSLKLSWTNPTSDFSAVRIFRSTMGGVQGELIANGVTGTSYTDMNLTNGTRYYYWVQSYDAAGNGTFAAEVSAVASASTSTGTTTQTTSTTQTSTSTTTSTPSTGTGTGSGTGTGTGTNSPLPTIYVFNANLRMGMRGDAVRNLQTVLATDAMVYPEGLVTGYFGPLTRAAVIRFQEKHAAEILIPVGLTRGTGFVGASTRAKLNMMFGNR